MRSARPSERSSSSGTRHGHYTVSDPSPNFLICHQCGAKLTEGRKKPVYAHATMETLGLVTPIFCSTKCAHVYRPENLTLSKLRGLWAQVAPVS